MVYLLKIVIFHGKLLNNQMVSLPFIAYKPSYHFSRRERLKRLTEGKPDFAEDAVTGGAEKAAGCKAMFFCWEFHSQSYMDTLIL